MIITLTAVATDFSAQDIGGVDPTLPTGDAGEKINLLMSWLMGLCITASVAGLMICGSMLVYEKITGGGGNSTGKLVGGLVGSILIGSAAGLVNMLAL
ncbi:hypothetical protein [Rhodococcoides kyotonense]|uniref:Conjugal transfer protein TrbC n=1 Tax=Rhodococcoides kyotonense TaxID=398843 RepID=A0A177YE25_9NOCA|nr:hypothetical protein [Rhodococcus kyotonensis]OAK53792.1 hypothetical protein A3K89_21980 [Rhodococcus kyotonensis]